MSSPIPYEFDDRDIVSPGYSVALLSRYPLARLGRQFAPVDADDCAPGLEMEPGKVCASFDCDYDDHHSMHRMMFLERSKVWACVDCGHVARPSPGDDITRAAFDAMDRQASPLRTDR